MLYWYPLDFTFVCPTEIRTFQELAEDFADDGVEVVGCSTDSYFSHKAWFADRETFPQEITHPVIADTTHSVTRAFGVLKDDLGAAYRGTVIVDNEGIVRSIAVNDLGVGRSPSERWPVWRRLEEGRRVRRVSRLETIARENWEDFLAAPAAVLMLGKSDCPACAAWTEELTAFLEDDSEWTSVRFGKLLLDQPGLGSFKKANPWLAGLKDLPLNLIYIEGEKVKEFLGSGAERLANRLRRLLAPPTS